MSEGKGRILRHNMQVPRVGCLRDIHGEGETEGRLPLLQEGGLDKTSTSLQG